MVMVRVETVCVGGGVASTVRHHNDRVFNRPTAGRQHLTKLRGRRVEIND